MLHLVALWQGAEVRPLAQSTPVRLPTTLEQGVEGCLEAPPHGLGQAVEVTGLPGSHPDRAVVPLEPVARTLEQGPWRPAVAPPLPLGKARRQQDNGLIA